MSDFRSFSHGDKVEQRDEYERRIQADSDSQRHQPSTSFSSLPSTIASRPRSPHAFQVTVSTSTVPKTSSSEAHLGTRHSSSPKSQGDRRHEETAIGLIDLFYSRRTSHSTSSQRSSFSSETSAHPDYHPTGQTNSNFPTRSEESHPETTFSASAGVIGRGSSHKRKEAPTLENIPSPLANRAPSPALAFASAHSRVLPPPSYAGRSDPFRRPPSSSAYEANSAADRFSVPSHPAESTPRFPRLPSTKHSRHGSDSLSATRLPGMSITTNTSSSVSTSSASLHLWTHTRSGSDSSHSSTAASLHTQQEGTAVSQISPSYSSNRSSMNSPASENAAVMYSSLQNQASSSREALDRSANYSRGIKRKESLGPAADRDRSESSGPSNASPSRAQSGSQANSASGTLGDPKGDKSAGKRIKTARACDSCRRKKIRCDVIDDGGSAMGNPNNGNGGLICAHCRQYGFECTFFLPITETRFKKKREREADEAAAASGRMDASMAYGMPHPVYARPTMAMAGSYATAPMMAPLQSSMSQEWPPRDPGSLRPGPAYMQAPEPRHGQPPPPGAHRPGPRPHSGKPLPPSPPPDTRVLGPTSIAYIVHSTAFVPGAAIEAHDIKHNQTFEVGTSGDGIIKFHKPPKQIGDASDLTVSEEENVMFYIPESIKGRLAGDVVEKLVNTYYEKVAMFFPVMTKSEFLHLTRPPPLLLYAICGVSALSREVPRKVLGAVKTILNAIFKETDLLSDSNSATVRALLILSLHPDLHGMNALQSGSRCWNRTGIAIRMAQDLGLNRDASGKDDMAGDAFFLEQKRRIWGCCVTADRCLSVSLGHPLAIDLTDCDVRLPSPFEILRSPNDPKSGRATDRPFAFNTELLKLTILFGRVTKTIYSPTGLMKATDEKITSLLSDIDRWKDSLPEELRFRGPDSSPAAGILHVAFACLMMLFFRVFMRISYACPTHLTFSLTIERMSSLIRYSAEAIAWVDKNDFYLDTMQIVSYSLVFCAILQYHAWVRRSDQSALENLEKLRDIVMRYKKEDHVKEDDLTVRGKTAEVVSLLYESASGAYANSPCSGHLNPTAGVTNRKSKANVQGIVFKADATRPGGGVYVATEPSSMLQDLPQGTIILQENEDGSRIPALVRTGLDQNGGWQTFEQYRQALTATAQQGVNQVQIGSVQASSGDDKQLQGMTTTSNGTDQQLVPSGVPTIVYPTSSDSDGALLAPPPANLTHLAGDVWQDAEGRPVNRRGSRLLTMVPVSPGLSGGGFNGEQSFLATSGSQLQLGRNPILPSDPNFNFNPHLNDGFWAPAEFVLDRNNAGGLGLDTLMLDGLPGQLLDFANWDAFFSKLNQPLFGGTNGAANQDGSQQKGNNDTSLGIEAQLMDPSIMSRGGV